MNKGPFRFDQVGSLLRSERLKKANSDFQEGIINKEEYQIIKKEEIKRIVEIQKELGCLAITDGEFNREYWHYDFISYLNGIENYVMDTSGSFQGVMHKLKSYYVFDRLSFPSDHPFIEDYRYLHQLVGEDGLAKFTIPGPNMIYYSGVLNSPMYQEHTHIKDLETIKKDIIKVYQEAINAFYEAGCRYLQFDDTSWGAFFSEKNRQILEAKGIDCKKTIKEFADLTIECIKNKPEDMILTTHVCRGNFKSSWLYEGDYSYAEKEVFRAPFDGYFLEFDTDRSGSFAPIQYMKQGKLVLGLITSKEGILEDKDIIKARIQEATQYLPLDQLCISPQCGFSSTKEGNDLTERQQWDKLTFVKEIANEIWK